jgi:hypothetical protein
MSELHQPALAALTILADALEAATNTPAEAVSIASDALTRITREIPTEESQDIWFNLDNPPPDEPVLVTINDVPCATPGNLTTATAQKKSGKSAFFSAIVSAAISDLGDNLGVKAFNAEQKVVLHFDTEQSPMDHYKLCKSILKRAQVEQKPPFFQSCRLANLPILKRQAKVRDTIRQQYETNGVFIAMIDGHGDLVRNVNDPEESADYVAMLHALAIETHCHIYGALHLNPGSEFKSRGHLGSELERKSQTNLRLEKADEIFCAWGTENRGAPIPKNIGPCFAWSNEAGMHVSIETRAKSKADLQTEDAKMKVLEAFRMADKRQLHYAELVRAIEKVPGVKSASTAERLFRAAKSAKFIAKNLVHQWQIAA